MRQLPCTGNTEDRQLDQDPPNHATVGRLGLVSEFGLPFLCVAWGCISGVELVQADIEE